MTELASGLVASEADRLAQAEALVRSYCGWHIAPPRTEDVSVNASYATTLTLPTLRLTAVSAVTEDGEAVTDDFDWTAAGILTRAWCRWSTAPVVVSLTHGYDEPPPEVTAVVQAVAQRAVDNPGSRPRDQVGPFAESYSQVGLNQAPAMALLDAEKEILDRYRIPPRP